MEALAALETMVSSAPDQVRRLAALLQLNHSEASKIAARLRLSRDETHRLDDLIASRGVSSAGMKELALRRMLYALGREQFCDLILLDWADQIAMNATEPLNPFKVGGIHGIPHRYGSRPSFRSSATMLWKWASKKGQRSARFSTISRNGGSNRRFSRTARPAWIS